MRNTPVLVDPTGEVEPARREPLTRPASLDGKTVALLDISKARGDVFLDRLHMRLDEQGIEVKRYMKPTFARTAPIAVKQQIASEAALVVEGLAD